MTNCAYRIIMALVSGKQVNLRSGEGESCTESLLV